MTIPGFRQSVNLNDAQQIQQNEDDHDDEQHMDGIARTRDAGEDIRSEIAEQPQDEQNYDDPGKHKVSPFN
jgi:hypothetical protein